MAVLNMNMHQLAYWLAHTMDEDTATAVRNWINQKDDPNLQREAAAVETITLDPQVKANLYALRTAIMRNDGSGNPWGAVCRIECCKAIFEAPEPH